VTYDSENVGADPAGHGRPSQSSWVRLADFGSGHGRKAHRLGARDTALSVDASTSPLDGGDKGGQAAPGGTAGRRLRPAHGIRCPRPASVYPSSSHRGCRKPLVVKTQAAADGHFRVGGEPKVRMHLHSSGEAHKLEAARDSDGVGSSIKKNPGFGETGASRERRERGSQIRHPSPFLQPFSCRCLISISGLSMIITFSLKKTIGRSRSFNHSRPGKWLRVSITLQSGGAVLADTEHPGNQS